MMGNVVGYTMLYRPVDRKYIELVNLPELGRQFRRSDDVSGLPSGDMKALAKREDNKGTLIQLRISQHRLMLMPIEDDVLIHFIADEIDAVFKDDLFETPEVSLVQYHTTRIVWGIDHDEFGP